jgi:hypothetical protein
MNNGTDLLWDNMHNPILMGFLIVLLFLIIFFGLAYIWLMWIRRW